MEKITYLINRLLEKQLDLYETLHDIALKDREYIVNMDVDALWETTQQKKQVAAKLENCRNELINGLKTNHIPLNNENEADFDLLDMIQRSGIIKQEQADLKKKVQRITGLKADLIGRSRENMTYLNEYLAVINGIFSTVLPRKEKGRYSAMGRVETTDRNQYLFKAEV